MSLHSPENNQQGISFNDLKIDDAAYLRPIPQSVIDRDTEGYPQISSAQFGERHHDTSNAFAGFNCYSSSEDKIVIKN
jgi:hypothetical protein